MTRQTKVYIILERNPFEVSEIFLLQDLIRIFEYIFCQWKMAEFLHVKYGASLLKAVLRLTAVFGLNTLIHCRLSSQNKYAINIFAVNHSVKSLGVNASHETPDNVFRPATLMS